LHFPFPDQVLREAIWRSAFPARTPLAAIDNSKLARLNITGGNIRNIALNAAFRAAELERAHFDDASAARRATSRQA
jgi:hypothetical protein